MFYKTEPLSICMKLGLCHIDGYVVNLIYRVISAEEGMEKGYFSIYTSVCVT